MITCWFQIANCVTCYSARFLQGQMGMANKKIKGVKEIFCSKFRKWMWKITAFKRWKLKCSFKLTNLGEILSSKSNEKGSFNT